MAEMGAEEFLEQIIDETIQRAGLGKGTTIVDNDLIETAFFIGAGVATGFVSAFAGLEETDRFWVETKVTEFLDLCAERALQ